MLLSELMGKVLVNLENGEVLGDIGEADLLIDELSGEIDSILLPTHGFAFHRYCENIQTVVKWKDIRKIGPEIIVVEIQPDRELLW